MAPAQGAHAGATRDPRGALAPVYRPRRDRAAAPGAADPGEARPRPAREGHEASVRRGEWRGAMNRLRGIARRLDLFVLAMLMFALTAWTEVRHGESPQFSVPTSGL